MKQMLAGTRNLAAGSKTLTNGKDKRFLGRLKHENPEVDKEKQKIGFGVLTEEERGHAIDARKKRPLTWVANSPKDLRRARLKAVQAGETNAAIRRPGATGSASAAVERQQQLHSKIWWGLWWSVPFQDTERPSLRWICATGYSGRRPLLSRWRLASKLSCRNPGKIADIIGQGVTPD
jgi:hypothetical protein